MSRGAAALDHRALKPSSKLTETEREAIREQKPQLLARLRRDKAPSAMPSYLSQALTPDGPL